MWLLPTKVSLPRPTLEGMRRVRSLHPHVQIITTNNGPLLWPPLPGALGPVTPFKRKPVPTVEFEKMTLEQLKDLPLDTVTLVTHGDLEVRIRKRKKEEDGIQRIGLFNDFSLLLDTHTDMCSGL